MPHAFAWNMGTIGSTVSLLERPTQSGMIVAHRMQHQRPMRIENALGLPRRSRRIAHRGRAALVVQVGERLRLRRREQRLVVDRPFGNDAILRHDDDVLERHSTRELLERRPEHIVDDRDTIAGVVGDVGQVVGMETQVERMQHEPRCRQAEVRFEVTLMIPRERGDAIAGLESEPAERSAESSGAQ